MASPSRLSQSMSSLSLASSDASSGSARATPTLCPRHQPPRLCGQPDCAALHICRLFADGFCPHGDDQCRWGHTVARECNRPALQRHGLTQMPERQLLWLVRALLQRTAPVSDDEYRRQLQLCQGYAISASCPSTDCFRLHLCPQLVEGGCVAGAGCRWSHQVASADNLMVLLRLRCTDLDDTAVLRLLQDNQRPTTSTTAISDSHLGSDSAAASEARGSEPPPARQAATAGRGGSSVASGGGVVSDGSGKKTARAGQQVQQQLSVCRNFCYPSKCPDSERCRQLHVCRFFVADICPYGNSCTRKHSLHTPHNDRVLMDLQLASFTDLQLLTKLRTGWLKQNPITNTERQFLLQLCRFYVDSGNCELGDYCYRLHVCKNYVSNTCVGRPDCVLSHQLDSSDNAAIIRRLGLTAMTSNKTLQMLTTPVTSQAAWDSWASGEESGLSSGGGSATRGQAGASQLPVEPVVTPLRQTTSLANPEPSPSSSEQLAAEVEAELSPPRLCAAHAAGQPCPERYCHRFHVCGFFLANLCRRADNHCGAGHSFQTQHNLAVMSRHQLIGGSPEDFQTLLDEMTLHARIVFKGDAQMRVQMCIPYNSPGGCVAADCARFHLCHRFLSGGCTAGGEDGCGRRHRPTGSHNRAVWQALGLHRCLHSDSVGDWATDQDILELLRAKLGVPAGRYEGSPAGGVEGTSVGSLAGCIPQQATACAPGKPAACAPGKPVACAPGKPAACAPGKPVACAPGKPAACAPGKPAACAPGKPAFPVQTVVAGTREACSYTGPVPPLCRPWAEGGLCEIMCYRLHLCPHWLRDNCRRGGRGALPCTLGHELVTPHNSTVFQAYGQSSPTICAGNQLQSLLEQVATAAGVPSKAVYQQLRVCVAYNHDAGCHNGCDCPYLHVCQRFVAGSCDDEQGCGMSHSVLSAKNRRRVRKLGLNNVDAHEVLEMLAAVHGTKAFSPGDDRDLC